MSPLAGVSADPILAPLPDGQEPFSQAQHELAAWSASLIELQERERRNIARELHDEIGQSLSAIRVQFAKLRRRVDEAELGELIDHAAAMTERTLGRVRGLSLLLHPPQLDTLGLEAALRWHVDEQARLHGVRIELHADGLQRGIHPDFAIACYRIVQEALSNALRHANAATIQVRAHGSDGGLAIEVCDDGVGFLADQPRGVLPRPSLGLIGMGERARLLKGHLKVSTRPGEGTSITAFLPWHGIDRHSTVVLADDHQLVRAGLRSLIEEMDDHEVVAEADDGEQALALVARHKPAVLLLDINMPRLNGLQVLTRVRHLSPETRVLVVSMHDSSDFVMEALRCGADGYLLKDAAAAELRVALDALALGQRFLSPAISAMVVDRALSQPPQPRAPAAPANVHLAMPAELPLTSRQVEILKLLVSGRSMKEVAYDLGLSVKTVETHRAQIMDRLNIHDLPRLVLFAVRHGLVSAEQEPCP